ncbi:alpha/beta hydrolase [Caenimonas sp. SL110]|uniref:alpha/beta hydrolase n=1 Tax=Caenimonas sp. SL110 TaxID=1450524 RepID=UPI00065383C0|nr:alpha/beta hydrolase [Caenimonas sp. SL110]
MSDHPAVESVVARVKAVYGSWRRDTTVAQMRADWDHLFNATGDASVEPIECAGVACQWITAPGARTDKAIMYLHGGGFQVGSLASHRELMAELSAAAGVRVLGVAYRLAPEHRYPAALEDTLAVWHWLQAHGFRPRDIALAGDSAGGGLALSTMLALQEKQQDLPAAALLMSAWTDLTASGESYQTRAAQDPIHQRPMILAMARNYLGKTGDATDPLVSPLMAAPAQLRGLPPMLLQVGDCETVLSDSEAFARKAREAGANARCEVWPAMIHVFQQFPAELHEARQAMASAGQFLEAHLGAASKRKTSS